MKKVNLGKSSLSIAPLVFGGNVFGWTVDKQKSFELLDVFYAGGFNCIDTADVYSKWVPGNSGGESEVIIGEWMKSQNNRSQIIIATKLGMEMGPGKKGLSKNYIKEAVEASLKRLQTDYIDLYQAHQEDSDTLIEETLRGFEDIVKEGKVRFIGASNYSPEGLRNAIEVSNTKNLPKYETLQPRYNLYDREDFEKNLAQICEANGLGVIPYYSLASGFLSGKYRSIEDLNKSPRGAGVKSYLSDRGYRILDALDIVSRNKNSSPTQVSIAWLNHQTWVTAALASATSPEQLQELMRGATLSLDQNELDVLNKASSY